MEIQLKLGEVLAINQVLQMIIEDTECKLDVLFKFKLLGILKSIENHISNFEIIKNEKINEYGEQTKDGQIRLSKDNEEAFKKFNDDIRTIMDSKVSIHVEKLKAEDLFDKITKVEYLKGLYPIIEA